MDYQTLFRIAFCFIVQSALLSLRYWYYEALDVRWVGLLIKPPEQESDWSDYLPSRDSIGNWTLLLFPIFNYFFLHSELLRFRSHLPKAAISEVAFQVNLLTLLHPMQLSAFLSPQVHLIVVFAGILFLLSKISKVFEEFTLLKFGLFTVIVTFTSALAAHQFLHDNPAGYTLGIITLLSMIFQGNICNHHIYYQLWCGLILFGASSVGLINILTSSWDKILNVALSTVYYSNNKAIDYIFPFLRSNPNHFQLIDGKESYTKITNLLYFHDDVTVGGSNAHPWIVLLYDIPRNFAVYSSLFILLFIIFHLFRRLSLYVLKWNEYPRSHLWLKYYAIFIIFNLPNVILSLQEKGRVDKYNYFDLSTMFIVLLVAFSLVDSRTHSTRLDKRESDRSSDPATTAVSEVTTDKFSGWSDNKRNGFLAFFLGGSLMYFFIQFST